MTRTVIDLELYHFVCHLSIYHSFEILVKVDYPPMLMDNPFIQNLTQTARHESSYQTLSIQSPYTVTQMCDISSV